MSSPSTTTFSVNGRHYHPPAKPVVMICLDGCADEYLDAALARGRMPNLNGMIVAGFRGLARAALPSFTNVNNASLVTGAPPSVHGISGNYFFDAIRGEEVMMNSAEFLRAETIPAAAARAGRRVAVVTAKDKLREILARGLTGIAFSSEKADQAHLATHGITHVEDVVGCRMPPIYSAEASLFVLEAGAALIEREMADFLYLSLTDYVQHKFEPEAEEALDFYGRIDVQLGRLLRLGARIGATADHGMNAKQKPDGTPNLIYLEDRLNDRFGAVFRVILPITDPYVRHHGALGSFANVYCPNDVSVAEVKDWLLALDGITEVHDRRTAARLLELPEDRIGELVVLSGRHLVLGRTPAHHDLSLLEAGLRSHGGRYEEMVPFLISEPLRAAYAAKARGDLRNFDLFEFTINGCQ